MTNGAMMTFRKVASHMPCTTESMSSCKIEGSSGKLIGQWSFVSSKKCPGSFLQSLDIIYKKSRTQHANLVGHH